MDTHKVLKGITIGDIGPKWGYSMKDNGFMAFDNVRYPRDSLLGKYTMIDDSTGELKTKGNLKVLYAGMMFVRENILIFSAKSLAKATIIATRYSNVRTQFKIDKNTERTIIDYQTQRGKIYPYIAKSYAAFFSARKIQVSVREN